MADMDQCARCGAEFAAGPQCPCGMDATDSEREGEGEARRDVRPARVEPVDGVVVAEKIRMAIEDLDDDEAMALAALALYTHKRAHPDDGDIHMLETGYLLAKRARVVAARR